jgi:predicted AAA+ superfamily ATPase
MIKRQLEEICFNKIFGRQMRFIAGPRQVGKTTLAKSFLTDQKLETHYFNWDLRETRDKYKKDPYFFETAIYDSKPMGEENVPWVCLDEIHKMPKWKNILKDYFDKFENVCHFIVTGSARLDWFKKSGDSLAGRYFLFKLFPFCLSEVTGEGIPVISENEKAHPFIEKRINHNSYRQDALDQLLNFSGFPEPFTKADTRFHLRWQRDLLDRLIKEDIRDLTKIIETENIATIIRLLPERVGAPLSLNSLKEDVEISYNAVKSAISTLQLTYIIFLVPPYSERIARSLKKEKKCYFFDWTRCTDFAKRFENYVALELKIMVEIWNDSGIGNFNLFYVRTKDGKETDFLITKNELPWCFFEVKLKDRSIDAHHYKHSQFMGDIPVVQITHENNILKKSGDLFYRISASRFF